MNAGSGPALLRVLIVDDDEDDFILLRELLAEIPLLRAEAEWARDYDSGLAALREARYGLYLVDFRIGALTGLDFLRAAAGPGVVAPVIIITGQGNLETDLDAMAAGAADYLEKGRIGTENLGRTIRYALERARLLAELQAKEERYRLLYERSPMPMLTYDQDSQRVTEVNDAALAQYGYSREQFLAMTALDLRPEEERPRYLDQLHSPHEGYRASGLWRHRRHDGSEIVVDVRSHDFELDGKRGRLVLAQDVTAEQEARNETARKEQQLHQLLRDATDGMLIVDDRGLIRMVNPAARQLLGGTESAILGRAYAELVPDAVRGEVEFRHGQELRAAEVRLAPIAWEGVPAQLAILRDVTERRHAQDQLRLLRRAVESTMNGILIVDADKPDMPIIYVNPAFEQITGYWADETIGRNCRFLQGSDREQPEIAIIRRALAEKVRCDVVLRNYRRDGSMFLNQICISPVMNSRGEVVQFVGVQNDITERLRYETELAYIATHDRVTGLPTFLAIEDTVDRHLRDARPDGELAVLYVDLDRFHAINDTLGHGNGDAALKAVADRLRLAVGDGGQVGRVASDEFVILLNEQAASDADGIAERCRHAIEVPIAVAPYTIHVSASIGISRFPANATRTNDLLSRAESAMTRAKRIGGNAVIAFHNDQAVELEDRLSLGRRLREAVPNQELVLHYQPQVRAHNGQIIGLEALVRWNHPQLGLLPPGRFIRIAEELGLIVELGRWVLHSACLQARIWRDAGLEGYTVAVNVSALQFQRPSFVDDVREALRSSGLPPQVLELELTESSIMENIQRMSETMTSLKQLGVKLALDDFGIGYSSLHYLKRLPIDKLKIDQSFVAEIPRDSGDAAIARAIIAMGHQLHMTVMAEGVETEAQLGYLRRNHCDEFQGQFFSPAVPSEQIEGLLRRRFLASASFTESLPQETLLVVDDEENILRSIVRLLRRDGYRIVTATSAREGLELLGRQQVHVIVSDQRIPEMSGTEFLQRVKELYPDTVRIVLSGYTDLESVTEAINRGAIYKFLTKPWNDDDLREQIRGAFRTYAERVNGSRQ